MYATDAPRYAQFLQQILGTFVVRAGLTDVAESSRSKYLAAASSRIMDELSYQTVVQMLCWNLDTATGDDLDRRAAEQTAGNIVRRGAVAATGNVVFYALNPGGTVTIPAGTQVQAQNKTSFVTTAATTLSPSNPPLLPGHVAGQDSGYVPVVASVPGSAGNQPAGSLTVFGQRPSGIDGVTNVAATQFGQDQETDDSLRARVRLYASSLARSTPSAILGAVLGAQDDATGQTVACASLVESETQPGTSTLYIDDGSGQVEQTEQYTGELLTNGLSGPGGTTAAGGETTLTLLHVPVDLNSPPSLQSNLRPTLRYGTEFAVDPLNGRVTFTPALSQGESITGSYTAYSGLLALAQKIIDGDSDDPINFPGYRAAGTRVAVMAPQTISTSVSAICAVDPSFDPIATRFAVQAALVGYINGLTIGQAVQVANLTQVAMAVPGMKNFTLTAPLADMVLLPGQLARTDPSRVQVS